MRSTPKRRPLPDRVVPSEALALVARAVDIAYYQWQPGCEDLYVSPALRALFGGDSGAWTMQRWLDAVHPNERADYEVARTAFLRDATERATFRFRVAGGS